MPVNWPDVIGRKYSDIKKELDALKGKEQEESSPKRKGLELLLPERKLGLDSLFKGVYKTNRLGNPFRDLGISDKVTPSNAFQWKPPVGELQPLSERQQVPSFFQKALGETPARGIGEKEAKYIYDTKVIGIENRYPKAPYTKEQMQSNWFKQMWEEKAAAYDEYQVALPKFEESLFAKGAEIANIPFRMVGAQIRNIAMGAGDVPQPRVEELIKEGRFEELPPYESLPLWQQFLWETPAFLDVYRTSGKLLVGGAKALSRTTVKASLNAGLDKWITTQSRLSPKYQSKAYPFLSKTGEILTGAKNKNAFVEEVTNNFLKRTGKTPNKEQAIRDAFEEVADIFIPKGPQTGIVRGGIGKPAQVIKVLPTRTDTDTLNITQSLGKKIGLDVEAIGGIAPGEYWVSITTPALKGNDAFFNWTTENRSPEEAGKLQSLLEGKFEFRAATAYEPYGRKKFLPFKNIEDAQKFLQTGDTSLIAKTITQRGEAWTPEKLAQTRAEAAKITPFTLGKPVPKPPPITPVTPEVTKELLPMKGLHSGDVIVSKKGNRFRLEKHNTSTGDWLATDLQTNKATNIVNEGMYAGGWTSFVGKESQLAIPKAEVGMPEAVTKESWQMTQEEYIIKGMAERPKPTGKPSAITLGARADEEGRMWFRLAHEHAVGRAISEGKPVPAEVLKDYPDLYPEAPQAITKPVGEVVSAKEQAAQLAEQVKAKLAAQPVVEKPTAPQQVVSPIERRAEIQSLLTEPAKNLPKGTTKIALRKELAGINKSLIPQEKKLRQQIMATVKAKSLGATQYRGIFKTTGGSRYLTNLELTQLEKVLKAVQKARPKKIGGKTVVTQATEKAIQSLKTELIKQGKYTQESFDNTKKYLRLKTDRFESPTKFISEVQAKELIRRMNYEAEIGLIENDSLIAKALKNRPDVQSAIDKAKGRMTASSVKNINGKPVNVAATYDMRYYTGFLQERTGGRFYDIWAKANKIRLENKQEALKVFSKVEKVPGYKKVAADNDALDRIRRHIAAKNKWAEVESPELSKIELAVANALEDVYKMFPNMVREFRFKVSYDRHNGNVDLISSEIPDAPKADLREAINIYESQGRDALKTYLDTKTWGVIESGYEPRLVVNPKLRLNKIKDYVVGKGRLHAREGLEFPTNKENILKDTRVYINQMLNLKLEPYMKELDRIYSENASKLKNPQKAARNLELALLEMQGKTIDRTPLTDILMKVSGYGYSAIFLRPSLAFRNLFQNLAFHPDRESFLNPMNRKLTDEELAYWETYIRQNRAFKSDILLQEEIGAGRVAEFVKRISYYGYSDDVNRLGSFWASLNKAEGALLRYKKDGDVGKFIGSSGLQDLTNLQQKEGLELLVTDETEAIRYIAREVTNNTHFLYDRAQRAPLEMGSTGRILASLLTFTRSWAQRLYIQLNTGLKSGSKVSGASKARAWKNVIGIIVVGLIAGEIYKKITGKERNPYDPRNILSWTPGGLPIGLAGDIALALTHLAQALTGDKEAQSRLTTEIPALGDDFIPFYSQIIGIAESLSDTQFIDRKFLRDIRAKFDKDYQPNESYYKKERGIIQKIQHALFGSEPEVAEPKKGGGLPNPFKKEVTPGGGSSRPGNPFR